MLATPDQNPALKRAAIETLENIDGLTTSTLPLGPAESHACEQSTRR